ncbi:hypothetical protein [Vibrio parahaemolyticus]|uniref:hypothetical protein n=1 Tax=Vibrio parahaemolyticus TaxID=670 RepID=UPI002269A669|nr:hypothetical protein [Vibrio parahaemolyticus]MCX8796133.1 hypothetical protein [Vibrio parahaemolyticus]
MPFNSSFLCPITTRDSKFSILRVFSNIAFWLMLFAIASLVSAFISDDSAMPHYSRFTMILGMVIGVVVIYFDAMYQPRISYKETWSNASEWCLGTKVGMMTSVNFISSLIAWSYR